MIEIINVLGLVWLVYHCKDFYFEFRLVCASPKYVFKIPNRILNCLMCLSFWVSLVYTNGNIPLSGFISLIAFCIDKYLISTPIKL